MQKSKNATIIIILLILLYGLFANLKLEKDINILYLYIINPIFWIRTYNIIIFFIGKKFRK